jgi:hypothetical protein
MQPILDPLGVRKWEIERIVAHRVWNCRPEYWVQWKGYEDSRDLWVHRDTLVRDFPSMLIQYHAQGGLPTQARKGAPKRATTGRRLLPGEDPFPHLSGVNGMVVGVQSRVGSS